MQYDAYSTEDFLVNESFQAFVLESDPTATQFWRNWLLTYPARETEFNEAVAVLQLFVAQTRRPVPASVQQAELAKLWQSMRPAAVPTAHPVLRVARARRWAGTLVAAVVLVLVGLGLWRQLLPPTPTWAHYAAPAGQHRQLTLPDGSRVTLNANSALRLAAAWPAGQPREVWLSGEAFFKVRHLAAAGWRAVADAPTAAKFIVHAGALDVAVLGTQFNVRRAAGKTNVVLSEGQIQLRRRTPGAGPEQVLMQPGELVEYDETAPRAPLRRRPVRAAYYSAWTSGHLDFDNTPVAEIVALLEDSYGLKISLLNPDLARQKLTGSVPNRDLDGLLSALSKSLDATYRRQGSQVWLE